MQRRSYSTRAQTGLAPGATLSFTIPRQWDSDLYVVQAKTNKDKYNGGITVHNPNFNHDGIILEPNLTRHAYSELGWEIDVRI